jgi:TetR/AcrR family transcriptional regulator, transcriptional repressor of bet genes
MKRKARAASKKRPGRTQRRRDLLGTVYTVISENGIEGASMRQIADRANVSTGTINYHFGNKHKLIMAALQAVHLTPAEGDWSADSPLAQLKIFAFSHIFRSSTDRFWRFWVNCAAAGTRNTELRKHQNRRFEKQQVLWAKLVQESVGAGELPSFPNAQTISEQLMIFTHGLVMRQILQPGNENRLNCEKLLEGYFEALERPQQA